MSPGAPRVLFVFALLSALMGTSVGIAKFATPIFAIALGAHASQIGLIASGGAIGMLLMALPVGFLVDHWGPRRLFVAGSVLGGIAYALVPLVGSPRALFAATTVVGFFMPLRFVSFNTAFFEQVRTLGDGKAGWSRAANMSGVFLAGPTLGALLVAGIGLASTWWLVAASFALTVALSPLALSSRRARGAAARPVAAALPVLLRDRDLRRANMIDFVSQATTNYATTFLIVIALQVFHQPLAMASSLVTVWGACFVVTLLAGSGIARRLGAERTQQLGMATVVAALATMGSAPGPRTLLLGAALQGLGAGLVQLVNLAQEARAGARLGTGRVAGLNMVIGPLGGLVGGSLGGWLGQRVGLQAGFFAFIAGWTVLGAWLAWSGRAAVDAPAGLHASG